MYSAYKLENHNIIDMKWFMSIQNIHMNDHKEKTMLKIHTTCIPKKYLQLIY